MSDSTHIHNRVSPEEQQLMQDYYEHVDLSRIMNTVPMSVAQFRREREKGKSMLDVDNPIHTTVDHEFLEREKGKSMLDVDNPIHTTVDHEFLERIMELASRVEFGMQCKIKIGRDNEIPNGRYYFQIACWRMDVITKKDGWGFGGKAYLSRHMTDSELFQIMFGLYKGYWEHEARENMTIDGVRPFGPHISTEALISVARKVDVRSAKHVEDRDIPFDTNNEGMGSSVFDR